MSSCLVVAVVVVVIVLMIFGCSRSSDGIMRISMLAQKKGGAARAPKEAPAKKAVKLSQHDEVSSVKGTAPVNSVNLTSNQKMVKGVNAANLQGHGPLVTEAHEEYSNSGHGEMGDSHARARSVMDMYCTHKDEADNIIDELNKDKEAIECMGKVLDFMGMGGDNLDVKSAVFGAHHDHDEAHN